MGEARGKRGFVQQLVRVTFSPEPDDQALFRKLDFFGQELEGWIRAGYIEYLGRLDHVCPVIADSRVYGFQLPRRHATYAVGGHGHGPRDITTGAGCRERERVVGSDNGYLVASEVR